MESKSEADAKGHDMAIQGLGRVMAGHCEVSCSDSSPGLGERPFDVFDVQPLCFCAFVPLRLAHTLEP